MIDIDALRNRFGSDVTGIEAITNEKFRDAHFVTSSADQISEVHRLLRAVFPQTGLFPLLLGEDTTLEDFDWNYETAEELPPAEINNDFIQTVDGRRRFQPDAMLKVANIFEAQSSPQIFLNALGIDQDADLDKPLTEEQLMKYVELSRGPLIKMGFVGAHAEALMRPFRNMPLRDLLKSWESTNQQYRQGYARFAEMCELMNKDEIEADLAEYDSMEQLLKLGETLRFDSWCKRHIDPSIKTGNLAGKTKLYSPKPPKSHAIILIPIAKPWHVPAFLRFGSNNDSPAPHVHVAALKRWCRQYNAEPYLICSDALYLSLPKPLTDKVKAMQLAREQTAYCPDLYHSGDGTVGFVALQLLDSHFWQFWWD